MFCCFKGIPAVTCETPVAPGHSKRPQQDGQSVSQRLESARAGSLLATSAASSSYRLGKGSGGEVNGGGTVGKGSPEGVAPDLELAKHNPNVWMHLVDGLRSNVGKKPAATGSAVDAACCDADHFDLRLPASGSGAPAGDIMALANSISDPIALVLFERTTKRGARRRRLNPHLFMDINMDALFAGGMVPHPCQQPSTVQSLDASGGGAPTAPSLSFHLQRAYCNAEAIRLSVHHCNPALFELLGLSAAGTAGFEQLLAELLAGEPMLRAVLHDSCLCLLEGIAANPAQLMVHQPLHGTASRVVLPLTLQPLVVWRRLSAGQQHHLQPHHTMGVGGESVECVPMAGVVLRYTLSAGLQATLLQLHRVYAMLSSLAGIVTLFTLRGKVLHQNTASIRYMGLRQGPGQVEDRCSADAGDTLADCSGLAVGSILRQIFALSPEQLDDMLEDVVDGKTWKGIVHVPPLLTPTIDPGPAQAAVLAARGTMVTPACTPPGSHGQVLSTWERLGTVLMSTQPGNRPSTAHAASDMEAASDAGAISSAIFMAHIEDKMAAGGTRMAPPAVPSNRVPAAGRSTLGGPVDGSTADSCIFLAMGSTSGTRRLNAGSALATQSSMRTVPGRSLMGRKSSNDLPDHNAQIAAALSAPMAPHTAAAVGSPAAGSPLARALSNSARTPLAPGASLVVPQPMSRANSTVRMGGPSLLRTLMEHGGSISNEMEAATVNVMGGGGSGGSGTSGPACSLPDEFRVQRSGLSDAARRSIVRRRSALKLGPSAVEDNPLCTSTWGLLDGARLNTLKRIGTCNGTGTENISGCTPVETTSSLPSGCGGANSRMRPPSRLMSFLANKNIGGAGGGGSNSYKSLNAGGGNPNVVWSAIVMDGSGHTDGVALSGNCKPIASTTELEVTPRLGSSLLRGGSSLSLQPYPTSASMSHATPVPAPTVPSTSPAQVAALGTQGRASSPRGPPARRALRPPIEDVAEESGAEGASSRLTNGLSVAASSVQPGVLPQLTGIMQFASRGSTASQRGSTVPGAMSASSAAAAAAMASAASCATTGRGSVAVPSEHVSMSGSDDDDCWHDITASTLKDPVSGEQTLLLMQVDVSARVRAERRIAEVLEAEHKLLENVFPRHVLEMAACHSSPHRAAASVSKFSLAELPLAQNCASLATYHPMVTILFSDIIGFTSMCHEIPATKVMEFLNNLYLRLDTLLDVYGVYKVETIGDCYMVAGGLMTRDADGFMTVRSSDTIDELHAAKVMSFAKAMLRETSEVLLPTTGKPVQMRIGLHSGPVMSGIVGSKMPRFCLFGDTVNTASRMESTCPPGCIHVSASTREYLPDEDWEATGGVNVKGKGVMETFRWVHEDGADGSSPQTYHPRRNRPRRASSVAYIQTNNHSRGSASGHFSILGQTPLQTGAGGGGGDAAGVASGTSSCVLHSCSHAVDATIAEAGRHTPASSMPPTNGVAPTTSMPPVTGMPQTTGMGPGNGRAASASMSFNAASPHSNAGRQSMTMTSRGIGSGAQGSSARRKPHRSCSTTALAYKGLSRPC